MRALRMEDSEDPGPQEEYEAAPQSEKDETNGHPKVQAQSYEEFKRAAEQDRAVEWVLKPFLPPTGLVVIAGEQKSGKTLWVSWLVSRVLARDMRVLFIELEGSRDNLLDRLDLFCRDPVERLGCFIRWRCGDKLDGKGLVTLLSLVEANAPNLIVIDPLFRAMQGDENDSKTWRPIVENLETLSTLARCPVAILHHVRKAPSEGRDAITSSDIRGSSALLGAASVVAIVHKKERTADGTARFDVVCADSWYAPFPTQRCLVTFGAQEGEEAMTFVSEEDVQARKTERSTIVRLAILRELGKAEPLALTGRALEGLVGGRAATVREEIAQLVQDGQVIRTPGRQRAFLYRLAHLEAGVRPDEPEIQSYHRESASPASASPSPGTQSDAQDAVSPEQAFGSVRPVRPLTPVGGGRGDSLEPVEDEKRVRVPPQKEEGAPAMGRLCVFRDHGVACTEVATIHVWCPPHVPWKKKQ